MILGSPDNGTSVTCLDLQGIEFSCPLHQGRNCKVCQYFLLKGVQEYLQSVQILLKKEYISILPSIVFICSIPFFFVKKSIADLFMSLTPYARHIENTRTIVRTSAEVSKPRLHSDDKLDIFMVFKIFLTKLFELYRRVQHTETKSMWPIPWKICWLYCFWVRIKKLSSTWKKITAEQINFISS